MLCNILSFKRKINPVIKCDSILIFLIVIWVSLLIQNCLVAANAVLLSFMFYYSLTVCDNVVWFGSLMVGVILLGALANLATVANTISVERDWVVVIADNNSSTLAGQLITCSKVIVTLIKKQHNVGN